MTDKTILLLTYGENRCVSQAWLKGFLSHARTLNWRIETAMFSGELEDRDRIIRTVRFFHPDGIVSAICDKDLPREVIGRIPCVWMDAPPALVPKRDSLVSHDATDEVGLAAQELLSLKYAHYAVVGDQRVRDWSMRRVMQFCDIMRREGLSAEILCLSDPAVDRMAGIAQIETWLAKQTMPCGIFAVNDSIASLVVSAASRLGVRVPEEVAVIGIDNDEDICLVTTPPLTSVATDWERGGILAAEAMAARLNDPKSAPRRTTFGAIGIVRRATTSLSRTRIDPRVAKACQYIREHACEGIGVEDVARCMACSRRLAMMRFLETTGHSIFAAIRDAQFSQVMLLLSRRDVQLSAIADMCGWKSPTALRTYFAKRTGMTMRAWRLRNTQTPDM